MNLGLVLMGLLFFPRGGSLGPGKVEGEVKEKITSEKKVGGGKGGGQKVKGSKDDPRYRVESDKTGAEAAHKPDALEKK